jgi:hypothetical protein
MPPRRIPVRPSADPEEPIPVEDLEEEDLDAEVQKLQAQLAARRKRGQVLALRKELASDSHESLNTTSTHKRGLSISSSAASHAKRVHVRAKEPTTFEGKSLREYREHAATCYTYFAAVGGDELENIELAATYLRGNALSIWVVKELKPTTWDTYLAWAKSLVADPANRMADASLRLKSLVQKETQSVRDVATLVEELEEDLLDLTPGEERAWRMLNILRPEIRREVLRENRTITSREQVIIAAQRQEELLRQDTPRSQGNSVRGAREPDDRVCFKCRKPGHIAIHCPMRPIAGEKPVISK